RTQGFDPVRLDQRQGLEEARHAAHEDEGTDRVALAPPISSYPYCQYGPYPNAVIASASAPPCSSAEQRRRQRQRPRVVGYARGEALAPPHAAAPPAPRERATARRRDGGPERVALARGGERLRVGEADRGLTLLYRAERLEVPVGLARRRERLLRAALREQR